ncbi:MAG: isocitrate lyase/phosphoenolpyruvate mutase family protein [Pseudomonadota bacterium]
MSRWANRRARFRSILNGDTCIFPASTFDPITARIAQEIGYEVGMLAGSTAAQTVLAAPDYILLTLTEFADQAQRISRVCDLPLMTDADHGYGNALNVARTVEELEAAGVAGLSIEDTALPEPFGSAGQTQILSLDEGVGKIRAAVAAKSDPSLVVAGRTSAPAINGLDDGLRRARAYQDAGADMIFLIGIKTWADLDEVAKHITLPIMLGGAPTALMTPSELAARGVRICLQGHHTLPAAIQAIHQTLTALRDGVKPSELENLADKDFMNRILKKDVYDNMRKTYLN